MHTPSPRAVARTLASVVCWTVVSAGTLQGQDPKAVRQVETLRSKGTATAVIAQQIAKDYRLDAAGTALVFRAARVSATETAGGLQTAFRVDVSGSASALRRGGYRAEETAPALVDVYRTKGTVVMDAMRRAEFSARDLELVAVNVLQIPADERVAQMKEDGATTQEAAIVLKNSYHLAPAPAGDLLFTAQFETREIVEAFRLVWGLDVHGAYQAMQDMTVIEFGSPYNWLETAGYEVPAPTFDAYRIPDYRPGHSGQVIEKVGVVDPDKVIGVAPDPSDGVVQVLVRYRGLDALTATLGDRVGEIVERVPHTYQAQGSTWDGEWLHIRFRDFPSGYLKLERLTRTWAVPARALAYHVVEPAMIIEPIEGMTVSVGESQGSGTVTLPAGTFGGVAMEGASVTFEVPTHQEAGIVADVRNLASNATTVTTSQAGEAIEIKIAVAFETAGAEVEGTFLDYVPCWTCASFRVPQSTCSGINISCFLGFLGALGTSAGTCLDPDNWEEGTMANGPALPFQADLTDPALEIRIALAPDPATGAFAVKQVLPSFNAGVTLRTMNDDLPLYVIQDYIMGQVNQKLMDALAELDLGGKVVSSLELARATFGWGALRGLYLLGDGRWFLDSEY